MEIAEIKEHEDGSATVVVDLTEEERQMLITKALTDLFTELATDEDPNDES